MERGYTCQAKQKPRAHWGDTYYLFDLVMQQQEKFVYFEVMKKC